MFYQHGYMLIQQDVAIMKDDKEKRIQNMRIIPSYGWEKET
ncbi:MAG: hypothetical protein ACRCST_00325 [Turicibacter sp.]